MRSFPLYFGWFPLLAAACTLGGCASGHDEVSKRLASLQEDVTRLENHSDRLEERLEALELRKEQPAPIRTGADTGSIVERPKLMVVKLEPGDSARDGTAEAPTAELRPEDSATDQTPRPVIRVHGSKADGDVTMASDSDGTSSARRKR